MSIKGINDNKIIFSDKVKIEPGVLKSASLQKLPSPLLLSLKKESTKTHLVFKCLVEKVVVCLLDLVSKKLGSF